MSSQDEYVPRVNEIHPTAEPVSNTASQIQETNNTYSSTDFVTGTQALDEVNTFVLEMVVGFAISETPKTVEACNIVSNEHRCYFCENTEMGAASLFIMALMFYGSMKWKSFIIEWALK